MLRYRIDDMHPERRFLSFDIRDILDLIGDQKRFAHWRLLDLWVTPDEAPSFDMSRIEAMSKEPAGWMVSHSDLDSFSRCILQTIDGLYAGYDFDPSLQRSHDWADLVGNAQIVIEAVDSSYWLFWSRDESIMRRIPERFKSIALEPIPG